MYNKTCVDCKVVYQASGPAGKYCCDCAELHKDLARERNKIRAYKRRRKAGAKIGQGALPGADHPNYKHGLYVSQTQCRQYKEIVGHMCERCGKDLHDVSKWEWVMHHKDHNHCNHELDNLELLCKRCHQVEHRCIDNLKVQRPSRKGVGSSDPKRAASDVDDDMV